MKKLPIFDIFLNEEDLKQGVGMISLVDDPAIGVNWIKLAENKDLHFSVDKEKQMLYGPFLIPNMLIYRSDEKNGEYYVRFSKEEIAKIADKFNDDLNNRNINFMHSDQKVEAFVSQNWVIEGDQDKSKNFGFELQDGTWFGGVKIKDQDFWKEVVKTDKVKGFSVEILADLELSLKNKSKIMKTELKFKKKFIAKQKFDEGVETEAGEIVIVAEEIAETQECVVVMDDLTVVEDYTGTVEVEGDTVVIEDGVIKEVAEEEAPAEDTPAEEEMEADEEKPAGEYATPEQVSQMIDVRFNEIMEEITRLKDAISGQTEDLKKVINEKFKMTPATESVRFKVDERFKKTEDRVREFSKINK